ncbi:MAG: anthranilate phosphoribosyltransferase [Xanthomonadales bacterium]|nr:anthranilate phosphoribosyltransferase [Xanthomonadales bacterium]
MDIKQAIALIAEGQDLDLAQMRVVMQQIMEGESSDAQTGALLLGLRMKGESVDEITAAVMVMRELATRVELQGSHLVDIVGTGGDGAKLFNVSTATAFVAAAGGAQVAKHGNRSVSSSSGSADLLEAAGVRLDLTPAQVADCVRQIGIGFMFAPGHHTAMRHAIGPRRELGLRTLFNILGPMTNPAGVKRQLVGVYAASLCRPMAEVLDRLGAEHVMVVHSRDGLDEISTAAPTHVAEARDGKISEYDIEPGDFGRPRMNLDGLTVANAQESLELVRAALSGEPGDRADCARGIIALNAGAALYVADRQPTIGQGVAEAMRQLETGAPWQRLQALAAYTSGL